MTRSACALITLLFALVSVWAQGPQAKFTLRGRWPGHPQGRAADVAMLGRYAYLSLLDTASILVLDVSNPAQPVWVKNFDSGANFDLGGTAFLATVSNRVYLARSASGLAVFDVTAPLNPVQLGALESGYDAAHFPYGIQVLGSYAYLMCRNQASSYHGLDLVDVRDPARPVRIASLEIPAQIRGFQASGDHVYVATFDGGLWIVDVSDPAHPVIVGRYEPDRSFFSVAVSGHYACVTQEDIGLVVVDVSDPVNPTAVETYLAHVGRWGNNYIRFEGRHAYLETDEGLDVIEISDPTRLTRVGRYLGQLAGQEFQVVGDYGWFAAGADGLQVMDFRNPANPVKIGGFATGGYASQVRVVGNRAYLADGGVLQMLDVSDPEHPVRLGGVEQLEEGNIQAMAVSEPYAYVAATGLGDQCCTNAFFVFDVSNPAAPARVGSIIASDLGAFQIRLFGDHAVVAGYGTGEDPMFFENLMFFDLSNRAQPVRLPGLWLSQRTVGISVVGQYLYVACLSFNNPMYNDERFVVLDVGNPLNPVVIGTVPQGEGGAIDVAGHYAYVAVSKDKEGDETPNGLEIFDVSNPGMPVSVGACEVDSIARSWQNCWPQCVQVQGQYAYLAVNSGPRPTLTLIDIKDPARPQPVGTYEFQGGGTGGPSGWGSDNFQVVGNLLYVAEGAWGLTIVEVKLPGTLKLNPPVLFGNTLTLSWNGGAGIKLQKSASLTAPGWQDVAGSDGVSQIALPATDAAAFFRLIQP